VYQGQNSASGIALGPGPEKRIVLLVRFLSFSSSFLLSSLELSDTKVYAPYIRARLGTTAHYIRNRNTAARDGRAVEGDAHGHPHSPTLSGLDCLICAILARKR